MVLQLDSYWRGEAFQKLFGSNFHYLKKIGEVLGAKWERQVYRLLKPFP